jgi:hypothetical protein
MNHETLSLALALTMAGINGRHTKGEWQDRARPWMRRPRLATCRLGAALAPRVALLSGAGGPLRPSRNTTSERPVTV